MKLFQSIQVYFAILGIKQSQKSKVCSLNPKNSVVLMILVHFSVATTAFILYDAKSFKEIADAFYPASTSISAILNFIAIICNSSKFFELIEGYESAIQSRLDNQDSKKIYEETNQQIEKWSKLLNESMRKLTVPSLALPKFIIGFVTYFVTDLRNAALQLQYPMRLPFAWKNPLGSLVAMFVQYTSLFYVAYVAHCHTAFISASCWMLTSMAKDVKQGFEALNGMATANTDQPEFLDNLRRHIEFHWVAKQLAREFSTLYQRILLCFFVWSNACICAALLMIQMEIAQHTINRIVLVFLICALFWSFGFILFFCEFGQRVSDEFADIHDIISQFEWHEFPLKTQKLLHMLMTATQHQVTIQVFGSMSCQRETFKKVVNAGFSYFTMLREFGE